MGQTFVRVTGRPRTLTTHTTEEFPLTPGTPQSRPEDRGLGPGTTVSSKVDLNPEQVDVSQCQGVVESETLSRKEEEETKDVPRDPG